MTALFAERPPFARARFAGRVRSDPKFGSVPLDPNAPRSVSLLAVKP
jgi:hypothetical protein